MIKTLQKKFLLAAMTAVSVLILLMVGTINIVNYAVNERQIERTIFRLAENDGQQRGDAHKQFLDETSFFEGVPKEPPRFELLPEGGGNSAFVPFFLVRFDTQGSIVYAESRVDYVTEQEAKDYARLVRDSGKTKGRTGYFRYMLLDTRDGAGSVAVFLDSSIQQFSLLRVLVISVIIGCLGWLAMFLLVRQLSRRAILPIAQNIEKQRQFVTNAGHEIKTPLAIILANVDALELHNGENKWSRNIRSQTMRLSGLMQNLLLLSKMEEGGIGTAATEVSISELLEESVNPYLEPAQLKGIEVQTDIAQGIVRHLNRENLAQLFSVLLDNALKYTPQGGRIKICLQQEGRHIQMRFSNTCEKVLQENPERLFDRFYRGDDARTQKNGGYGIGLSVARAIVESLNGKVRAQYGDEGELTFFIEID